MRAKTEPARTRTRISGTLAVVGVALLAYGCSSIERSRSIANPAVPAKTLAQQVCSICHGMDGNSISPNFPRLAGQTAQYLAAQLRAFRSHNRLDPPGPEYMWGISRSLTDRQIDGLAEYFSSQKPIANAPGDPRLAAEGARIFKEGIPASNVPACATCHGANGEGNGPFPRIAGQHADYVMKELLVFKRTEQRPEGTLMKPVAHALSAEDIAAVANYVQGLPPR